MILEVHSPNLDTRGKRDARQIAQVLESMLQGPRLANELPKLPNSLMVAEAMGFCSAECLRRCKFTATSKERSIWQWSITQKGRHWLRQNNR